MKAKPKAKAQSPPADCTARYFHGTSGLAAVCIATDGFQLVDTPFRNWFDGALGDGIYITSSLSTAAFYTRGFIIHARLAPGTRVLRLGEQYDPRVIDSLRREFGAGILGLEFEKSIPANKHVRNVELIHLLNYLWTKGVLGKRGGLFPFSDEIRPLRRYLTKFHYAALGCPDNDIGIVVFNPSRLVPGRIDHMRDTPSNRDKPSPHSEASEDNQEAHPRDLAIAAASNLRDLAGRVEFLQDCVANADPNDRRWSFESDRKELAALRIAYPRWQGCLRRYCERFHLSLDSSEIAAALSSSFSK